MAFSCNIHLLPSFYCYEKVVDWFNKTQQPRRKYWEANERPLDGPAKHHYRIKRVDADTYQIILYQTPIVTWHGPNRVEVDVSYGGSTTMQFADRYAGFFGRTFREGGQDVFRVEGVKYQTSAPFEFAHVGHPDAGRKEWKLMSTHNKITRRVLDPDKAHVYRQASRAFKAWARGVWALSNDTPDGTNHPWVGVQLAPYAGAHTARSFNTTTKEDIHAMLSRQEDWGTLAHMLTESGWSDKGAQITITQLIKRLDTRMQQGMYITIPYDAPLPKRTK